MSMFKMNPMFAGDPQVCVVTGSYVFTNVGAAASNTAVQSSLFKATANAGGAAIGQNETVAPQGSKVTCVINPTTAYLPYVATNAGQNSICLLDLRSYPGDIICVQAGLVTPASATPGALTIQAYDASVLGIDQINNLVYIQGVTSAGAATVLGNGLALHFIVYFKDCFAP